MNSDFKTSSNGKNFSKTNKYPKNKDFFTNDRSNNNTKKRFLRTNDHTQRYKRSVNSNFTKNYKSRFSANRKVKGIDPNRFIKRAVINIEEQVYVPTINFQELEIDKQLKQNIAFRNYNTPTPIQDEAIPLILQGRDVFGLANTGTGKTAAFLIPLIDKCIKNPTQKVLIIAPTRELAEQIDHELYLFTKFIKVFSVLAVGGSNIYKQLSKLKRNFNFLIGTPGRIKDLYERKALNLSLFNILVLDEVDRMLDMGFIEDVRYIVSKTPTNRQTLFFSATTNKELEEVKNSFLNNFVKISVKTGDTVDSIDQDVIWVNSQSEKLITLINFLEKHPDKKLIVFVKTKKQVDILDQELSSKGFKVSAIHGDKSQYFRRKALKSFKDNETKIFVATDVASRGLDIPNVDYVINFDAPDNFEDYVHRIGRTGRAGKVGNAITFVVKDNNNLK